MSVFLILISILIYIIVSNDDCLPDIIQRCPSTTYAYCGSQGEICKIPSTIERGYISYGTLGTYNFIPFTNYQRSELKQLSSIDFEINCDDNFGDIYHGQKKYCCYISVFNGFPTNSWTSKIPSNSYYYNDNFEPTIVRFGLNNKFIYRTFSGRIMCNYNTFNDPYYGYRKYCEKNRLQLPDSFPKDEHDWDVCGNEGNYCDGLNVGAYWVRFGNFGYFYYRLIISKEGKIPCDVNEFDDPIPIELEYDLGYKITKYCWRYRSSKISNPIGKWVQVQRCNGCQAHEYKKNVGIIREYEEEKIETQTYGFESMLQGGFVFDNGGHGTYKINEKLSNEIINKMKHSLLQTYQRNQNFYCSKPALYQWVTFSNMDYNGLGLGNIIVYSDIYVCGDDKPFCPPGFCEDMYCMVCNKDLIQLQHNNDNNDNERIRYFTNDNFGRNSDDIRQSRTRDRINDEREMLFGEKERERDKNRNGKYIDFGRYGHRDT